MAADRETDLEVPTADDIGKVEPTATVLETRRPDAEQRSRRPRPQGIVDREGLFGPPDL